MKNGHIESLNGKFRDECLNENWFETLQQARAVIAAWRQDFLTNYWYGKGGQVSKAISSSRS